MLRLGSHQAGRPVEPWVLVLGHPLAPCLGWLVWTWGLVFAARMSARSGRSTCDQQRQYNDGCKHDFDIRKRSPWCVAGVL